MDSDDLLRQTVKGQILNRSELAEFFGVALTTVDGWVKDHCPYVSKSNGRGQEWEFDSARVATWLQERSSNKASDPNVQKINEAKLRKTAAEASMAELNLRERQGELVELSVVEKAGIDSYSACKARLMAIPTKLAPRLIGCRTAEEIKSQIEKEIHQALAELGSYEVDESDECAATADSDLAAGIAAATEVDGERVGGPEP